MRRRIAFTPRIPFHASCPLACHHIRPCTTDTGIFDRFVCIQSHLMTGGSFHYPLIVIDTVLAMMQISVRKCACISRLQEVDTMIGIPLHGMIHLTFIVRNIPSGLMMSHDFNAFLFGITYDFINIEIRVWLGEIKALHTAPTLPTFVPTFEQDSFDMIGRGKIYVFLCIGSSSSVTFVHLPGLYAEVHPPPHSYIFQRTNPVRSFQYARIIQIQNE